jgi:hypothetical protein
MRHCDATNDCDTTISSLSSMALLWMAATNRVDSSGLSPLGRRVKANAFEMFRRYFVAANVFRTGNFRRLRLPTSPSTHARRRRWRATRPYPMVQLHDGYGWLRHVANHAANPRREPLRL